MFRSEVASEKGGKGAAIEIARVDSHDSEDVHKPQSCYEEPPAHEDGSSNSESLGKWTRSLLRFGPLSG